MKAFRTLTARAAVLDRRDVDTDQILPKQFLKRIERTGYGEYLFFDWMREPDFPLRQPTARGARILICGPNFGCGSSREQAVWALQEAGFDVVVAPSFSDTFRANALKAGLVAVELPPEDVSALASAAARGELIVDLERRVVIDPSGREFPFSFDDFDRMRLLENIDDIALTLRHAAAIDAYESAHPGRVDTAALSGGR